MNMFNIIRLIDLLLGGKVATCLKRVAICITVICSINFLISGSTDLKNYS
jgi:hypothetical protein